MFSESTVKKIMSDGLEHDVRRALRGRCDRSAIMLPHVGVSGSTLDAEDGEPAFGDDRDRDAEQRDREHRGQHVGQHLADQ